MYQRWGKEAGDGCEGKDSCGVCRVAAEPIGIGEGSPGSPRSAAAPPAEHLRQRVSWFSHSRFCGLDRKPRVKV